MKKDDSVLKLDYNDEFLLDSVENGILHALCDLLDPRFRD